MSTADRLPAPAAEAVPAEREAKLAALVANGNPTLVSLLSSVRHRYMGRLWDEPKRRGRTTPVTRANIANKRCSPKR